MSTTDTRNERERTLCAPEGERAPEPLQSIVCEHGKARYACSRCTTTSPFDGIAERAVEPKRKLSSYELHVMQKCEHGHECRCYLVGGLILSAECCVHGERECAAPVQPDTPSAQPVESDGFVTTIRTADLFKGATINIPIPGVPNRFPDINAAARYAEDAEIAREDECRPHQGDVRRAVALARLTSLMAQAYGEDGFPDAPPFVAAAMTYAVRLSLGIESIDLPCEGNTEREAAILALANDRALPEYDEREWWAKLGSPSWDDMLFAFECFNRITTRLQECAQKHRLGLGGEFTDELVCDEVDRLREAMGQIRAATSVACVKPRPKEGEGRGDEFLRTLHLVYTTARRALGGHHER